MELNEYWSAQAAAEYKRMMDERIQQNFEYHCARMAPHILHNAQVVQDDGKQWRCILGNLAEGVCGHGATPEIACAEFDRIWTGRKR